jgi:CRP-like cAMP-binding protein
LISLQIPIADGHIVEVTLAGFEGLVGLPLLGGINQSFFRAMVQTPGEALRIDSDALQQFALTSLSFQQSCLRYADLQIAHTAQVAACNALHQVEPRLARWLLMAQDRTGLESLPFTHDFLSHMLVTSRSTVSLAAEALKRSGMINYSRGKIAINNRRTLEQAACQCYPILRDQLLRYQRRGATVTAKQS